MASETRLDRLEETLSRIAEAQAQTNEGGRRLQEAMAALAAAQARTDERMGQLAAAQARTEERVGRLEDATAALVEGQRQLAASQARTDAALRQLARQVGGLSETVGGDIEDIAYIVLYDVLKREFGWEVGVLARAWQRWNGRIEEIDVFGQATDPSQPARTLWIVGEAKHNLTRHEVERFARLAKRARRHLIGEVYAVCFSYRARPEVQTRLQELGIPLLFSYGRFAT